MARKVSFPQGLCVPTDDGAGMIYPFGRWTRGFVVGNVAHIVTRTGRTIRVRLRRAAWCLFVLLLVATIVFSTRFYGGPYISLAMRPVASTSIVSLPAMLYFLGRRLVVWRAVHKNPRATALGRLFVWANIDNAFGAATIHPCGVWVVAPWLDAGRQYRLDALSEPCARRIVWTTMALELMAVLAVCAALVGIWGQSPSCIYGISLYYCVSQPVWVSIQLHVLLPRLTQRWQPCSFDRDAVISKRYLWLRVFTISSVYMSALLLARGPQSLHLKQHAPMQTHLFLAAYVTASCYATLASACLVKTWARPWSRGSPLAGLAARGVFIIVALCVAAVMLQSYTVASPLLPPASHRGKAR